MTISTITVLEVVKGLHKVRRDDALERFIQGLDALEVLPVGRGEAIVGGASMVTSSGSGSRSVERTR